MMRAYFYLAAVLLPFAAHTQHESDNWVFGWNAGLRFHSNASPTYFYSQVNTREGVACISDAGTGNLLFYTNGVQVWDRSHSLMPNGSGLLGDYSAAQSSVIIPKPGADGLYYIFTAPQLNQVSTPYAYSVVDMHLANGFGDVVAATKNTALESNATEKLTVARHCNNRDFWVIMHHSNGNRFSVRLVDPAGVHAAQFFNLGGYVENYNWTKANYLKLSQDQSLLVHPIGPASLGGFPSVVEIFSFDNSSGTISGPNLILDGFQYAYATEFSADNRFLYVSDISTQNDSYIYQFDLSLGSPSLIKASKTELVSSNHFDYGALQMGPDGKIYAAKEDGYDNGANALDVIEFPGIAGSGCSYKVDALPLLQGQSLIGLPNFPSFVLRKKPEIVSSRDCSSGAFRFALLNTGSNGTVSWSFGDPLSGPGNSASGSQVQHHFSGTGQYLIRAIQNGPCGTDTVQTDFILTDPPYLNDTTLCQGGSLILSSPNPNTIWNHGASTGPFFTVSQPGVVAYQFPDAYGCPFLDSMLVTATAPDSTSETRFLCEGDTILVFGQPVTQIGTYSIILSASTGCDSIHTVVVADGVDTIRVYENLNICRGDTVYAHGLAFFENGNHTILGPPAGTCTVLYELEATLRDLPQLTSEITPSGCAGHPFGVIELIDTEPGASFRLNGGTWTPDTIFPTLEAGMYQVEVKNIYGCTSQAYFDVPEPPPYRVLLEIDTSLLECGQATLRATSTSPRPASLSWSPPDGLDCTTCAEVLASPAGDGYYTVFATDSAGCTASAGIGVPYRNRYHIYAPNVFSPNDDGSNDWFTLYGSRCVQTIRYLSIFDRWGGMAFHNTNFTPGNESQGWDGWWRKINLIPGVFTWIAEVELYDGRVIPLSGSVTVVR